MSDRPSALDDRDFMSALLDVMIPPGPNGDPPGAGALGLESDVVAGVRSDPMLGPMVEAGAEAIREAAESRHPDGLAGMTPAEGEEIVREQLASHSLLAMGLLRYLYPAYYQQPQVLEAIGEPPRAPFPQGFTVEPTDPELLERLTARGKTPDPPRAGD